MRLVLFSGVTLLFGLVLGFKVGRYWHGHLDVEKVIAAIQNEERDSESRLRMIELVQSGNTAQVVRIDCILLKGALPHINPEDFSGARASEVGAFLVRARAKVAELQASGGCSIGTAAQHE